MSSPEFIVWTAVNLDGTRMRVNAVDHATACAKAALHWRVKQADVLAYYNHTVSGPHESRSAEERELQRLLVSSYMRQYRAKRRALAGAVK